MNIKEKEAKSIITKSGLPGSDFVINPYVGCQHGCLYCYADFMKRFTNHHEPWGQFIDVKINAPDLIPKKSDKYKNKVVTMASVTDAYQPIEKKYKLTRKILEKLIPLQPDLCIITKSDLITRDIDLLKQLKNVQAGVSLGILDEKKRKIMEPGAKTAKERIAAVKKLHQAGINNFIFISPIIPEVSDWQKIVEQTKNFVDEYWFENLNIRATNWNRIKKVLNIKKDIDRSYWDKMEKEIREYGKKNKLKFKIYFHHQSSYS